MNNDVRPKSILEHSYLAQQANDTLHNPLFRYNVHSSSLINSLQHFTNTNLSVDRSRWTPELSSKENVQSDTSYERTTRDHQQSTSQPQTQGNSNENFQIIPPPSHRKIFLIGLSVGLGVSSIVLATVLALWLSQAVTPTTSLTSTQSIDSNSPTTFTTTNSSNGTTTTMISTISSSLTTLTVTSPTTISSTTTATSTTSWTTILYDFDEEVIDVYFNSLGIYNGLVNGSAVYVSPGITGYGYAMSFSSTTPQPTVTIQNGMNLNNASFTIEFWLYFTSTPNPTGPDLGIFGQCQSPTSDYCLHIMVRNGKLLFAFYNDDAVGTTTFIGGVWYHIACVFARSTLHQLIYVNGISEYDGSVNSVFLSTNTISTIGVTYENGFTSPSYFQNGLIDQLSITLHHSINASSVLDDATLTAYFSFDSATSFWLDNGPLFLNGTFNGNVTSVLGRVGRAMAFSQSTTGSFFQINSKFVLLAVQNQAQSYAFWINPTNNSGTIIQESSGGTTIWSMVPFGYTSTGQISAQVWTGTSSQHSLTNIPPLNTWTHLAMTYNLTVGIRLYVNGSLYATTSLNPMYYNAPVTSTATLTLGYTSQVNEVGQVIIGQFIGAIDELRIYSRTITDAEVSTLATV